MALPVTEHFSCMIVMRSRICVRNAMLHQLACKYLNLKGMIYMDVVGKRYGVGKRTSMDIQLYHEKNTCSTLRKKYCCIPN